MKPLESLSDQELDEIFAVEVLGWHRHPTFNNWYHKDCRIVGSNGSADIELSGEFKFSTCADNVIRWLERPGETIAVWNRLEPKRTWHVSICDSVSSYVCAATAPTFARAAVIALIKAHRAAKQP